MSGLSLATIGAVSCGIGGGAFLFLTALLLASFRGRFQGALLVFACALNSLWCFMLSYALLRGGSALMVTILELLRDAAWLAFAAWMLPRARHGRLAVGAQCLSVLLPAVLIVYLATSPFTPGSADFRLGLAPVFVVGTTVLSLLGLILVEQFFRSAGPERRWGVKYLSLALGTLFAYDFFLYSYTLLYHQINFPLWDTRGAVNALVVPLIAVSAARNPTWSLDVFVSRRMAFHTTALFGAGIYLMLMALGGYYVGVYGGSWGQFARIFLLAVAALVLLVLFFSGQVRAHAKVFINKHFFNYKYDYREEWLRLTHRLSGAGEASDPHQRCIQAVAQILDSPGGALWLLRDRAYTCVARWNLAVPEESVEPADSRFAGFLRERRWIVDVQEYENEPARYGDLTLPGWLDRVSRAWLFIPLFGQEELLGFVLLAAPRATHALTWEDYDLLGNVGSQVGGFLAQLESNQSLAQARQFEAYSRLSAFIMHDLKNVMAQQSLMVKNAERHKDNPDFVDDMIATVDNSVKRMNRLLGQLWRNGTQKELQRVPVAQLLRHVAMECSERRPAPLLESSDPEASVLSDREGLAMVIGHIVRNAQDAAQAGGRVVLRCAADNAAVRIEIEDNGAGMDPAFVRERLFQPFYTTKSSRGMGIGAYQARAFIRDAGGDVAVNSRPGEGTVFVITLPIAEPLAGEPDPMPREAKG